MAFTIAPPRDVRTMRTGVVMSYVAASRIAFGSQVMRDGAGTVKMAILEDTDETIGCAIEDEVEHLYGGFYEAGEMVPVAVTGEVIGLVIAIADTNLVAGDYLELADITSGTMASGVGVLAEAGSNAGETKTTTSLAQAMEDVTLGAATYKAPSSTPTAGELTAAMTSGDPTLMGVQIGDYALLRDSDGTTAQMNKITAITDTQLTFAIPITVAACDYIHAVRQIKMLLVK